MEAFDRMSQNFANHNPDLEAALAKLREEIASVRRQLEGVPQERRKGLWDLLEKLETNYRELEDALEAERAARRDALVQLREVVKEVQVNLMMAEVKVRWALWGLSGFGIISLILGAVTYILFNRLAGGSPP